jgi:hypothetical protein
MPLTYTRVRAQACRRRPRGVFNRYDLDVLADAARVTGLRYRALMREHEVVLAEAGSAKRRIEEGLKLSQSLEQQIEALRNAAAGTFGLHESLVKVTEGRGRGDAAAGASTLKRIPSSASMPKGSPPEPQVCFRAWFLNAKCFHNIV